MSEIETPALPDARLTEWDARTRACPHCKRHGGLRQLCGACRASMPTAPKGVKAQHRRMGGGNRGGRQ